MSCRRSSLVSGTLRSSTSRVIAIANTPSLKASIRFVPQRVIMNAAFHGAGRSPPQAAGRVIRATAGRVPPLMAGPLAARARANAGHVVAIASSSPFRLRAPARGRLRRRLGLRSRVSAPATLRADRRRAAQPGDVRPAVDGGAAGALRSARARDVAGLDGRRRRAARRGRRRHRAVVRDAAALGLRRQQVAVATAATAVCNAFANVVFAVAAVGFLAMSGESHPLLTTAAAIGTAAVAVALALFAVALQRRRQGAPARRPAPAALEPRRTLLRRRPATGWDERLVGFRREAVGLLRRRWLPLTLARCRPPHGLPGAARGAARRGRAERRREPGRGVRRLGPDPDHHDDPDHAGRPRRRGARPDGRARRRSAAHERAVVAAVLLYRVLTYVPPIALGGVCLLVWRRLDVRDPARPRSSESG